MILQVSFQNDLTSASCSCSLTRKCHKLQGKLEGYVNHQILHYYLSNMDARKDNIAIKPTNTNIKLTKMDGPNLSTFCWDDFTNKW